MSELSTTSSFSVVDGEERDLTIDSNEFDNSSVVSETGTVDVLDRTVNEQMESPPELDYLPYLTDEEKKELAQYPKRFVVTECRVVMGQGTYRKVFGDSNQFCLEVSLSGEVRVFVHYNGDLVNFRAEYEIQITGDGCEYDFYIGNARKSWEAEIELKCQDFDVLNILFYGRITQRVHEGRQWTLGFVNGPYFYELGDFVVKLKDGETKVSRAILAEFFPYFRAFFDRYPEDKQVSFPNLGVDEFKKLMKCVVTQVPFDHPMTEAWFKLFKFLGPVMLIADVDCHFFFHGWVAEICELAILADRYDYPVMKAILPKLIRSVWNQKFKDHTELIMKNAEFFIRIMASH
ncbi:unnamed protein product [Bursaphelenchus xylophilus]|uniref:(pine wood nematode) hypothetical protein n=1 Tax=Bursaphelenchus xylophilus TaxID=6326 RepID=A0A1I7RMR7_BURXY|nr:unnamed protein product [Bursaphelenchus xylophilus]CAG9125545.1 unnamed protein product [Bursaphelenchus xylophilus]